MANLKKFSHTFTADGNQTLSYNSRNDRFDGELIVHGSGNFGGGTFKIQFRSIDGEWKDVAKSELTENFDKIVTLPIDNEISFDLSGSTSPNLYLQVSVRGSGSITS